VSFAAITLCVASHRVFIVFVVVVVVVDVYFVIDSVRRLLDTLSYTKMHKSVNTCIFLYFGRNILKFHGFNKLIVKLPHVQYPCSKNLNNAV
jgi:hypothetical protein